MSYEETDPKALSLDPSLLPDGWSITRTHVSTFREGLPAFFLRYRLLHCGDEVRSYEIHVDQEVFRIGNEAMLRSFDNVAEKHFLGNFPDTPEPQS